jgi:hypothetical protein
MAVPPGPDPPDRSEPAVYREPDATGPGGDLVVGVSLQLPHRHGAEGLVPEAVEEPLKRLDDLDGRFG